MFYTFIFLYYAAKQIKDHYSYLYIQYTHIIHDTNCCTKDNA